MKNSIILLVVLGLAGAVYAVDMEADVAVDVKVASSYVWRGKIVNDEAVIQPSVTFSSSDWDLNIWGTWDLTDTENSSARTRVDFMLDYTIESGAHILSPGVVAYVYHDATYESEDDTFEAFLKYALDVVLLPSLTVNYDFGEVDGFYVSFALGYGGELIKDTMDFELRADVGAADNEYTKAKFTFSELNLTDSNIESTFVPENAALIDLNVSADFPLIIGKSCVITPGVRYMTLLDSDIKDATEANGDETDEITYSLMFSMMF